MPAIDRYPAEFDRMPHYGAEGCVCGNTATPDRECPLHAANWIIERLEDDLREALTLLDNARADYGDPTLKRMWARARKRLRLKWLSQP